MPESSPAAEQKPGKKKKKQDAARKQERKKKAAEEATAEQPGATGDVVAAPQPSPDAPKPEPVAEAPIEKQIEKAEETQTAVVPEKITAGQREELKKAEKKRRKKARENREELLGAAAAGAVIGALVPILGGKVVGDEGDRVIVERNGEFMVRRDESALFRDTADRIAVEHLPRGRTMETVYRRDGSQIVTIRDAGGYLLYRKKVTRQGREIVLYDARNIDRRHVDYDRELPPIRLTIPRDQYIVPARGYGRRQLAEVFAAPPVETLRQHYTLREVRESERLRNIVRRVDLDTITFDSGSYYVAQSQVGYLADIAGGMLDVIDENPEAVFLVEGHTDAVGSDLYNLTLSDRRAETVARILSEAYDVPPENLVVEGYGEQYLKIDTQGDERRNRRVTIRNISPLLETAGN
ncbi:MAG: OmpA family protein [Nitratireductor sp.]|nr:OmpA family protein [Nitratireductor sp.]